MQESKYFGSHLLNLEVITIDSESGKGLRDACYQLYTFHGGVFPVMSGCSGQSNYVNLMPGKYVLIQANPPLGYQSHPYRWNIHVDGNGYVWIDGVEKNRLIVCNTLDPNIKSEENCCECCYR